MPTAARLHAECKYVYSHCIWSNRRTNSDIPGPTFFDRHCHRFTFLCPESSPGQSMRPQPGSSACQRKQPPCYLRRTVRPDSSVPKCWSSNFLGCAVTALSRWGRSPKALSSMINIVDLKIITGIRCEICSGVKFFRGPRDEMFRSADGATRPAKSTRERWTRG